MNIPPGIFSFLFWKARMLSCFSMDLFLVLLGFFMALSLLQDLDRQGKIDLWSYWKKRFIRIVPSYYLLLLILALTGTTHFIDTNSLTSILKSLSIHLLFLQNYFPNPNGPTWYLGVAVMHYIAVPVIFIGFVKMMSKKWKTLFPSLVIAIIFLTLSMRCYWFFTGRHSGNDFEYTHFRSDSVFMGILCQYILLYCPGLTARIKARSTTLLLVAIVSILPYAVFSRAHPFIFTVGYTVSAVGSGIIVLLFVLSLSEHIQSRIMLFDKIGDWSYNIYLWHFFLPILLGAPFIVLNSAISKIPLGYLIQIVLFYIISIGVGYIATNYFERPVVFFFDRKIRI